MTICLHISLYVSECWRLFVVKQNTAYAMRISDWSSDVCSADLVAAVESYFVATLRARTPHGWTETIRNGRYIDDFRRRNGRWAIARRMAVIDASHSHPITDVAADIMLPGATTGAQHPTARARRARKSTRLNSSH